MTKNQIDYWKNLETKRNNLAMEAETRRANQARESETHRSNVAQEGLSSQNIAEARRHNVAQEAQASANLAEQRRHNVIQEGIDTQRNLINQQNYNVINTETNRHNTTQEIETQRHNEEMEKPNASKILETLANIGWIGQQQDTSAAQEEYLKEKTETEKTIQDKNKSQFLKDVINIGTAVGAGALLSKIRTAAGGIGLMNAALDQDGPKGIKSRIR